MYKLLLCVRYLQTRYLAFICIVSVMLGVATLIVVNSVMSGFSTKLKERLHGNTSDVIIDTARIDGFVKCDARGYPLLDDEFRPVPLSPDEMKAMIAASPVAGKIEVVSPTIEVFAMLQFDFRGQAMTKPVRVVAIDSESRAAMGGYSEFLTRQKNSPHPDFELTPEAKHRVEVKRKRMERPEPLKLPTLPGQLPPPKMTEDLPVTEHKPSGIIVGHMIAHMRYPKNGVIVEETMLEPGDDVTITTVGGGELKPVWGTFLVADYFKTEMSEYDQGLVYVPLEQFQKLRGMVGRCTALQIKLRNYEQDKTEVVNELRKVFIPESGVEVKTWEEMQGPLLSAIDVERGILNLLLFMIVGVAGFSILAIFTMIVSEKYRDIGILKSLGASRNGVLSIFLGYGLMLGTVGCALGTISGLLFTRYINGIEQWLSKITGSAVFPRDVYYFKDIPTNVDPLGVAAVNAGAILIALAFSVLPAWRAARLHPVQALRSE